MKKFLFITLMAFSVFYLTGCQNELPVIAGEDDIVTISKRSTPENAIEITPVDEVLEIEVGKNYVLRGEVSITGINSTTTASRAARLYIEGTLYLQDNLTTVYIPDGLLITVVDGGKIVCNATQVELGSYCQLLIESEGRVEADLAYFRYVYDSTKSAIYNYGYLNVFGLDVWGTPFYNFVDATAKVCQFNTSDKKKVYNQGTFINCENELYDY